MFPFEPNEYLDQYPHIFVQDFQNNYASSSSSSSPLSSHGGFFNSPEFHHLEMHQPPPHQQEVINHAPEARSHDLEKRGDDDQGLKFTLWKNEDQSEIKWMSSKMRLMRKMKRSDNGKEITSNNRMNTTDTTSAKFEDQKQQSQASPSSVTDHFSHTNASRYDNHPPIRVCADCNTTKTPLWRSGPKGPKSLCNACGIRQRKARRAMAAAAAAAATENDKSVVPPGTTSLKIKVQNKEFKKRCKPTGGVTAESSNNNNNNAAQEKKNGLEEFLFNLSKSLAFHRVFPQEEKDAAILLMALSCNRVHG